MRNSTIPTDNHSGGCLDKLKPSDQAFTLVEVTVALAIFAIAVVVLTQSFVNTLLSLDSIETEADLQADIRFVRSQALTVADREAFEEGDEITTLAHGTARWYATIESTQVSDLFQVQLTIELEPTDRLERTQHIQNLLLRRPTWSDPVERSEIIAGNSDRLNEERLTQDWQ